jgi:hypothetical protein
MWIVPMRVVGSSNEGSSNRGSSRNELFGISEWLPSRIFASCVRVYMRVRERGCVRVFGSVFGSIEWLVGKGSRVEFWIARFVVDKFAWRGRGG